ncbi:ribosome-recycling factor, mitochondrial [Phymastichus coffea]|uniref:ribosome-recycling factor, mitochondrial n=1 Tax=Phymastichus coffea TaxID=108790 RepID=UPI00273AD3B1|nr:ribosome-recycling factor, mitochondrial [Phymastichus coffea]
MNMKIVKDILRFFNVNNSTRTLSILRNSDCFHYSYEKCLSVRNNNSLNLQFQKFKSEKYLLLEKEILSRNIHTSIVSRKSKDRGGKEKKKPKASKIDLNVISELFDTESLINDMNQVIENLKADFIKNLTLRSTSGSLEQIPVLLDGKEYQLQELAQIARKPKIIVLNIASFPTAIPHILKAIEKSGLNLNPQQDGTTIFLPIPKVTKEHRENLAKNAKAIFIRHRDSIKDIRNKVVKTLRKRKDVSEDTVRSVQGQVEAIHDKYIKEAENILKTKQDELLG